MPTITPNEFVNKWKRITARERQAVQEHFIDLCHLVGHETPNEYDPSGTCFAFEMGASKISGGQGWADVAKLGFFGWEYKGKDANLDKAYAQLLRYRESLHNPPLLVVSDINTIIIRTNYTNLATRVITLTLDDLLKPESLKILDALFFAPDRLKPQLSVESVTENAARQFSELAGILRKRGETPPDVAHFLIRLLFCLFAEDVELLPARTFTRLLAQTRHSPQDFSEVLRQLFRAMNTGGYFGADKILHFNGGLFNDERVLELDGEALDLIAQIGGLDWAAIEPSIFGTLFERGLDPSKRSQLGAHYTGRDDILLIVEPVLMAPLRREWEQLQAEANRLKAEAERLDEKKRAAELAKISRAPRAFADRIATLRVLDPACGSGNFLYVALKLLLDLQKEISNFCGELGAPIFYPTVAPERQLYGIEINEYAHELAQLTIQIGYIQWLRDNGYGHPAPPILKVMNNIHHMDAILAYDEQGQPYEPQWPDADVIIGNPPFLGGKKMRTQLGDKYLDDLFTAYESSVPHEADLVCYWFEKARVMIEEEKVKRVGLLATNSIRGGANRKVLEHIKKTGDIFWAQSDREWVLNGAAVNVSMVGFDNGTEKNRVLDGNNTQTINSDLTYFSCDITKAAILVENSNLSFMGVTPAAPFDVPGELAREWLLKSNNPNGKPNSDVVKPYYNGIDITRGSRDTWIVDFGTSMTIEDASQYELPFEYIKRNVYPFRIKNKQESYQQNWWLFARARSGMRSALDPLNRYIAKSMVAKHHFFSWVPKGIVPANLLIVVARSDDYFMGVLHSYIHKLWAQKQGTSLEDRPRYTPTTTFETYPFPWPPGKEDPNDPRVQAIATAARELVEKRDNVLKGGGTLTQLYNQRPTWLQIAHRKLDQAVFAAYAWPAELSDEEILARLLALNLERAG